MVSLELEEELIDEDEDSSGEIVSLEEDEMDSKETEGPSTVEVPSAVSALLEEKEEEEFWIFVMVHADNPMDKTATANSELGLIRTRPPRRFLEPCLRESVPQVRRKRGNTIFLRFDKRSEPLLDRGPNHEGYGTSPWFSLKAGRTPASSHQRIRGKVWALDGR